MPGFGERLRSARRDKRLTLEQLAEKVGSSKAYIWQLENKEESTLSADLLLKLCAALGVLPSRLLTDTSNTADELLEKEVLFRKYEQLDQRDRDVILNLLEQMNARSNSTKS